MHRTGRLARQAALALPHRRCNGNPSTICGTIFRRRLSRSFAVNTAGVLSVSRRFVHERPFQELPEDLSQGEAYAVARDALLQLNIMHSRGIEPDALMYTSLIATMGRAGLEWQAYKLFSRMIEQNVHPLPETYVALRDATGRQRVALREQIETKIEEAVEVFPETLAEAERERQHDEDRRCIAKFDEYMRGVLPAIATSSTKATAQVHPDSEKEVADSTPPTPDSTAQAEPTPDASVGVSTMHIRSPSDAWSAAEMAHERRTSRQSLASGDDVAGLSASLAKLDAEELRIYLTAQRQMRHGSKEELIDRVLRTVNATAIRAMLSRRSHYFRSVEQILAADLRQLNMAGPADITAEAGADQSPSSTTSASVGRSASGKDTTMTKAEGDAISPEVLHAPWGILRKPARRLLDPPAPRNAERLERVRLSEPELALVRHKASVKDLDELPESLLRRYAYQFQLRWRRRQGAESLLQAVQWHVITYFSSEGPNGALEPHGNPTPAVRLQEEAEGMQRTLENFEAFRVIAQRTNNLQVVDSKEINRHLQHVRRNATRQERRTENALRRERHVMEAAGLAASARSYTAPMEEEEGELQVLGLPAADRAVLGDGSAVKDEYGGEPHTTALVTPDAAEVASDAAVDELPPWALFEEEEEFNLTSGRFGDPNAGRLQELSDSKIRILPSRTAQTQWSVDRQLLPTSLKDIVQEAELEQQRRHDAVEQEYERRLQYTKYRKWDHLIATAQQKRLSEREMEAEAGAARPLPPKQRLSQLLRKGRDRQSVSGEVRAKYNRSL